MRSIEDIKKDFPIFKAHPELAYLDTTATSQKPQSVIDAVSHYYAAQNANVHRGIYELSEVASAAYEGAREKVRAFINARSTQEIVFTRGTTESINLVAHSFSAQLGERRTVLISSAEHHSNIVPWQLQDYDLRITNYDSNYRFDIEEYKQKLKDKPDLVAINHASNVLGTINPIKEIIALAHEAGVKVLVDGAQSTPHSAVDVQDLDADFYVFSGHKICGPTGIGVLYAKQELLDRMPPYQSGGSMISSVTLEKSEWNELPWKFEAGTPNIAGAVGLGAAIDYINHLGFETIEQIETEVGTYALEQLSTVDGLRVHGPATMENRLGVFSFTLEGIHAHDIASVLDEEQVAVRAGSHCAMPLHESVIKSPATARASIYFYNTKEDIDKLIAGLHRVIKVLK